MSKVVRYDVGLQAAELLSGHLADFGAYHARRWPRWECVTFAAMLPQDAGRLFELAVYCTGLNSLHIVVDSKAAMKGAATLSRKIQDDLGLRLSDDTAVALEQPFLNALKANPYELVTWMAYADWLVEHGPDASTRLRGSDMADWLKKTRVRRLTGWEKYKRKQETERAQ